ncbi:MAG: hypothetical protein ACKVOR_12025, partial [Flavobacteriales bacterium]
MMNHHKYTFLLCIIALTLFNCNEPAAKNGEEKIDYTGFHEVSFELLNDLGKVTMMIPDALDSSEFRYASSCTTQDSRYWGQFFSGNSGKLVGQEFISELSDTNSFQIIVLKQGLLVYEEKTATYELSMFDSLLNTRKIIHKWSGEFNAKDYSMIDGQCFDFLVLDNSYPEYSYDNQFIAEFIHANQHMTLHFIWNSELKLDRTWMDKVLKSLCI